MNKSVQYTLFRVILFLVLSIVIVLGSFTVFFIYKSKMDTTRELIKQRNLAVSYHLTGYFTPLRNITEYLSRHKLVKNPDKLNNKQTRELLNLFLVMEKSNPDINYIYSGYFNNSLVINNYTPPKNYSPVSRPWFQAALKSAPYISPGIPYTEIQTGEWLISLSKVLYDEKNEITGVIAVDAPIDNCISVLDEQIKPYSSSHSFVIDLYGNILIHNRKDLIGQTIYSLTMPDNIAFEESGVFEYTFENSNRIAYYRTIKELGWKVITTVKKDEILNPIFKQITYSLLAVFIFSIVIGWIISKSITRNLITPLRDLEKRVKEIIDGRTDFEVSQYPYNEIGIIAGHIQKLTEMEFFKKNQELLKLNSELEILSSTDSLTQLINRRAMHEKLSEEYERHNRYKSVFSIIMLDIDYFKNINDGYGHAVGDIVLQKLGDIFRTVLRKTDIASRWGGEEFLILCPESNLEETGFIAEKLKANVQQYQFPVSQKVSFSAGIAACIEDKNIETLLKEADMKLYKAKLNGRDQIIVNV
ncbi:MAG: diguanylate cyclase [Spirochaetes bacterium]|nr:diguanylate cyclase [Spirochaetota bacterium]